ncbi:MAG: folate family ECF transporter S component [Anaeroplasmataceae bacterium]
METNTFLKVLKKGWSVILISLITGLLLGLLVAKLTYKEKYITSNYSSLTFRYTESVSIDYNEIISINNIERVKKITKSLETGNKVSTYKYVEITDISIMDMGGYFNILCNMDSFNVGTDYKYSDSAAKGFLKHLCLVILLTDEEIASYEESSINGHEVFNKFDKEFYEANSLDENSKLNIIYSDPQSITLNKNRKTLYYTLWITIPGFVFVGLSILLLFVFRNNLDNKIIHNYDNENIFRTPFHKKIFVESAKNFKNVKSLCMASILLGFVMISKFIPIPSGFGNLGINFAFIFLSVACMMYGPSFALLVGFLCDIIGYIIKPNGMFFIGYTIQSMFACFCYGMCLYKTHITFSKCLIARFFVNFVANVLIGGISWGIISDFNVNQTLVYMATISLPKNLVYLLPQSLVIYIVIKALSKPLSLMGFIDSEIADNISFF